jgi:ubiquitin C-terminal hydrolase
VKVQQSLPSKYSEELYHQVGVFSERHIQMEWTILNKPGCGLTNKDEERICKNMCYINAIIQCLANTAPFVEWLLSDRAGDRCE